MIPEEVEGFLEGALHTVDDADDVVVNLVQEFPRTGRQHCKLDPDAKHNATHAHARATHTHALRVAHLLHAAHSKLTCETGTRSTIENNVASLQLDENNVTVTHLI